MITKQIYTCEKTNKETYTLFLTKLRPANIAGLCFSIHCLFRCTASSHHENKSSSDCQQSGIHAALQRCSGVCCIFSACAVVDLNQVVYRSLQCLDHVVDFFLRYFCICQHRFGACHILDHWLRAYARVCAQLKAVHVSNQLFQSADIRLRPCVQSCYSSYSFRSCRNPGKLDSLAHDHWSHLSIPAARGQGKSQNSGGWSQDSEQQL